MTWLPRRLLGDLDLDALSQLGFKERTIPIVLLPGILGTRLKDPGTGSLVWNPYGWPKEDPGLFAAGVRRLLDIDAPLEPADETPTHPDAQPIVGFHQLLSGVYGDLAKSLHGIQAHHMLLRSKVYCCGYDWRRSNRESARRLAQVVLRARVETDNEPVVIVAHSMGGIVARYFCSQLAGEKSVRAVFLIGSPTLGAPKAYGVLKDGLPPGANFFVHAVTAGFARRATRRFPSIYELIPHPLYATNVDSTWLAFSPAHTGYPSSAASGPVLPTGHHFSNCQDSRLYYDLYTGPTDHPSTRTVVSRHLAAAALFRVALGSMDMKRTYMHPTTHALASTILHTVVGATLPFDRVFRRGSGAVQVNTKPLAPRNANQGDGTVPTESALPPDGVLFNNAGTPITRHEVRSLHSDMPKDSDVRRYVLSEIAKLYPIGFGGP